MVEAATLLLVLDVVERVLSTMVLPGLIAVLSVEKKKKMVEVLGGRGIVCLIKKG